MIDSVYRRRISRARPLFNNVRRKYDNDETVKYYVPTKSRTGENGIHWSMGTVVDFNSKTGEYKIKSEDGFIFRISHCQVTERV